jgi:formiminoglutamase
LKENINSLLNIEYQPAQKIYWSGRKSNPDIGNQYWHQAINLFHIDYLTKGLFRKNSIDIALLGYVCDEGVRRNVGRVGANQGPRVIRERLARLPIHFESKTIADFGDIICLDEDMESCQKVFSKLISKLIRKNIFPIGIGGGHDMAYAHFMGIKDALKNTSKNKIGIINFDAHFDLRPVDQKPNSGTPFNQIMTELEKENEKINYFAIGIQQQSNTKELFEIAKNNNINYAINYECESSKTELDFLIQRLTNFISGVDYLYVTIDLDGFSSAYAPGVSAPSPLGFTPYFVFKVLHFLINTNKVISCDIAEMNPSFDNDGVTSILAAKILDYIVLTKCD